MSNNFQIEGENEENIIGLEKKYHKMFIYKLKCLFTNKQYNNIMLI